MFRSIGRQHRKAKIQTQKHRGCTQNTQMATGPRLCLLPNVCNPRLTIERVAHGCVSRTGPSALLTLQITASRDEISMDIPMTR